MRSVLMDGVTEPGRDAAPPISQQGMSPTLPSLEGEDRGPDYAREASDARRERDTTGVGHAAPMPNGVSGGCVPPPRSSDEAHVDSQQPSVPPVVEAPVAREHEPLLGTQDDGNAGTMIQPPRVSMDAGSSGGRPSTELPQSTMYTAAGEPLFPQFLPSPLPGQSPVSDVAHAAPRASNWFSRLGDYIQRRVEVTSWSASQSAGMQQAHWTPASMGSSPVARAGATTEARAASVSSGGVSAEAVQAEVARQLEVAMGDMLQRLSTERQRRLVKKQDGCGISLSHRRDK